MNDPDPYQPALANTTNATTAGTSGQAIDGQSIGAQTSDRQASLVSASSDQTQTASNGETQASEDGWFTRLTQSWLARLTGPSLRSQMEGALAEDDGEDETFSPEEKAMLRNILELREMRVDDVMVPRADINAVEYDIPLGTLLTIYQDAGHSRLPVYRETLDDPVGMVHIKDVVDLMTQESGIHADKTDAKMQALSSMEGAYEDPSGQPQSEAQEHHTGRNALTDTQEASQNGALGGTLGEALSNHPITLGNVDLNRPLKDLGVIRDILFVPPSMPAMDLLATMRAERTQMALVIDEYGGTDGLISLEDVVETVVGDIEDEHDDEEEVFIANAGTNLFVADAKAELDDVVQTIGLPLPLDDESMEDVDTLGGFIFTHIGRIPVRGELITVGDGLEFEIMDADRRRIKRVKIRLKPAKKPIKRPAYALAPVASNDDGSPQDATSGHETLAEQTSELAPEQADEPLPTPDVEPSPADIEDQEAARLDPKN